MNGRSARRFWRGLLGLLVGLQVITVTPWVRAERAGGGARGELDVEAERVELDSNGGVVVFEGRVVLRHGGVELHCGRLVVRTSPEGELLSVEASGGVTVRLEGGVRARAGQVTYFPATRSLALTGRPVVNTVRGELRGSRVVVELASGRITVEGARGRFRIE